MSNVIGKDEFYEAGKAHLAAHPDMANRLAVGDVFLTQHTGAIATMLEMLSAQIALAETESWTKARDSMVMADAAARQIFLSASASQYALTVRNNSNVTVTINAGRKLLDSRNRTWVVEQGAAITAQGTGVIEVIQYDEVSASFTVDQKKNFYQIRIPTPPSDQQLLEVEVRNAAGQLFQHVERFNNVQKDEKVYHLHGDEILNVYITFGLIDKFGYVPEIGEVINCKFRYTSGGVTLAVDSEMSLEYVQPNEEQLQIFVRELIQEGANAPTVSELRELARYPSIYDENAVYLGEFQALVERKHFPFVFLNVWNELDEELVRGQSIHNINKLFVSFIKSGVTVADMRTQITRTIKAADNSYNIVFVNAVERVIPITINMRLKSMYDEADVRSQIVLWLVNKYGRDSLWAKRGGQYINNATTVKEMLAAIPQFFDGGSDLQMAIAQTENRLPENFEYVAANSITIHNTPI